MSIKNLFLITLLVSCLFSCKEAVEEPITNSVTCNTTSALFEGSGTDYLYNADGQITYSDNSTNEHHYSNGVYTGSTNSATGSYTEAKYEAGATFPSTLSSYDSSGNLTTNRVFTHNGEHNTSVETYNAAGDKTGAYYCEYDDNNNLTRWSADLAMGPPGTPLTKDVFVVDNIVTDDKPNPYKNKVMQLSFYQFPVFEGATNLVSADYSQLGSDALPCSSLFTYDENGNVTKNIFTFGPQTFTLDYTHECN